MKAGGQGQPKAGNVVGGVVLGLVAAVSYNVFAFFTAYALDPTGSESGAVWFLLFVAPAVVGAILLGVPRTRHAGAGLVIGLAVGLIAVPAACASPLLLGG